MVWFIFSTFVVKFSIVDLPKKYVDVVTDGDICGCYFLIVLCKVWIFFDCNNLYLYLKYLVILNISLI